MWLAEISKRDPEMCVKIVYNSTYGTHKGDGYLSGCRAVFERKAAKRGRVTHLVILGRELTI